MTLDFFELRLATGKAEQAEQAKTISAIEAETKFDFSLAQLPAAYPITVEQISGESDQELKLQFHNGSYVDKNVNLFVCAYQNNKLISVVMDTALINAGCDYLFVTESDFLDTGNDIQIFAWDSETMKPYYEGTE